MNIYVVDRQTFEKAAASPPYYLSADAAQKMNAELTAREDLRSLAARFNAQAATRCPAGGGLAFVVPDPQAPAFIAAVAQECPGLLAFAPQRPQLH